MQKHWSFCIDGCLHVNLVRWLIWVIELCWTMIGCWAFRLASCFGSRLCLPSGSVLCIHGEQPMLHMCAIQLNQHWPQWAMLACNGLTLMGRRATNRAMGQWDLLSSKLFAERNWLTALSCGGWGQSRRLFNECYHCCCNNNGWYQIEHIGQLCCTEWDRNRFDVLFPIDYM